MAPPFGTGSPSRRESRARSEYNRGVRWAAYFVALVAFVTLGSSPSQADEALWTGSRAGDARTETLLKALRAAGDHGLDPDWYRPSDLEQAAADKDKARAERLIAELQDQADGSITPEVLKYVNRLSDFLFVAARHANDGGARDVLWQPGQNR